MSPSLALLDASVGETPAERNFRRELDADLDVYKLPAGEFPPSVAVQRYDGVVISGSQTSVYDDHDWIHEATDWIRRAHAADIPVLGVCWGHQFLAQALGGRVVDMGKHELGYRSVSRVGADPLFEGLPEQFVAFETHHDRVVELPPGARLLARNEFGIQAFRVGRSYGVQFHPEYDRETAEWVVQGKELSDGRQQSVLDRITDERVAAAEASKQVFDNFLGMVRDHQPVTDTRLPGGCR
jgi:GMP synthase (glutamine-hydrolysing)